MSWQIDPTHSRVEFSARHLMITNVRGEFDKFSGSVDFDEQNPVNTTVNVEIDAASINTKTADRDNHLRSADFLDAANFPTITFKSTSVTAVDNSHAKLTGDLTIRGTTHSVVLDVEYVGSWKTPWGGTNAGFNAKTKINRKDWNLTWNVALESGGVLVGEDITIAIELELAKVQETTTTTATA